MASWLNALARTRNRIASALSRVFSRGGLDADTLEELEATLLQADLPPRLVGEVVKDLERTCKGTEVDVRDELRKLLVRGIGVTRTFDWSAAQKPLTVLVVGINGSGKTTTCAKLAHRAIRSGRRPLLCAGDTFRAAGSDQLRLWAERVKCEVVAGQTGADTAAVAYDAVEALLSRGLDVLLVDTAGRMHTKQPLMEELGKVKRAMAKRLPAAPHETWIVLDASMGQNALTQARMFQEVAGLTGVVIAKLDGSAKAGFVFAVQRELQVPVLFVGLGENMDDLAPFEPQAFVDALLGYESPYKEAASNRAPGG
jgi:fused signal recognition particle receptor